ncbi:MAG: AraC family transcriptional regulator [Anaerolineae bacterium]
MDSVNSQHEREALRAQANREELVERIGRATRQDGVIEPFNGLYLRRASSPTELVHGVSDPAFAVIAQGSKELYLGDELYRYDPYHYCLGTVDLPVVSHIVEASSERPYLHLRLALDPVLVGSVMVETGQLPTQNHADVRALNVSVLDASLLDAVVRLVRLLDTPAEARILMPLITREIVYRLLMGEQGARLRYIAVLDGNSHRVARAIEQLRRDFDQPLRIEDIAEELGMSVSSFHHHFKAVTAMSPLQFQKRLQLQEARRLMLAEHLDAASAGYRVGYDDASHFSREYKRLFGEPPMRDVERLRHAARVGVEV